MKVPLSQLGLSVVFTATCSWCKTRATGDVSSEAVTKPLYSSVELKDGWERVQTNQGMKIWCGDCPGSEDPRF